MTNEEARKILDSSFVWQKMVDEECEALGTAIKSLEQEPCEDAVSRQAVLDTIGNVPDHDDGMVFEALSHAQRDVALLPSVTPQPTRWIPVSERLPESSGVYIVTIEFNDGFECEDLTNACYFDGTSTWHNDNRINHDREYVDKKIKAWMPLPEPYKAESEE